MKVNILVALVVTVTNLFADISVSDVKAFSGYPWTEVVVGYTITGKVAETDFDIIELKATDKLVNKTYTTRSLTGAVLTEGRHVLRWNAAAEGVKFSSENVVFSVAVVHLGVQLWADGPYWAECNVGASKPEEYGCYFRWGDTAGCTKDETGFSFTDYRCATRGVANPQLQSGGYIDSTGNLVAAHDAAAAYLGASWRIPTDAEFSALISRCNSEWVSLNGVSGRLIRGRGAYSSNSIFLPAAGYGRDSYLRDIGSYGGYWSSTPNSDMSYYAWCLNFDASSFGRAYYGRPYGLSVRPVRGSAQ